jgi:hypothetical protein
MSLSNTPIKKSTASREKSSQGASSCVRSFESFVDAQRVMPSRRGDLLKLYQTLIAADAFPAIATWADLYRLMCHLSAGDDAIALARMLWREYQKLNIGN